MSKDIIVLTPNGRRQKVHCTPDTNMLQVLEDVCQKQGFQPSEYDLKHHNHILDLTSTVRFSNLPNKATLEMVEADRKREESNVTIGLLLEDGERRTADFSPNTSLFDMITSLAPTEFTSLQHPTILYMRQEVIGEPALRVKTLRQLGLIGGRAILRLLNKAEETKQANVSTVYRKPPQPEKLIDDTTTKKESQPPTARNYEASEPGPSNQQKSVVPCNLDPIKVIRKEKNALEAPKESVQENENIDEETPMEIDQSHPITQDPVSNASFTQENLERRLKIEEEVIFLGGQKAIAFMQPDNKIEELNDLPDDFYELTIDEVRKLYKDLQNHRFELENTPLTISSKKQELETQTSQQRLNFYKHVVVRIQFPDHVLLQGVFSPTNTIQDVTNFIKDHLQNPEKLFHIFTTPLKEVLDSKITLLEAKFVPCVHMHFKWVEENGEQQYLKEETYSKLTTSDAASILASKYRAPCRRKMHEVPGTSQNVASSSTAKSSKLPKWFKN